MDFAAMADSCLVDRVLVFGSLPPGGRDLDLLARPAEQAALEAALVTAEFGRCGDHWVDFREAPAAAVEIVSADSWRLPPDEIAELFDAARPLDGLTKLVRPAPEHALLIAARRFVRSRRSEREKLRRQVDAALAEHPTAWASAERRASAWRASRSLRLLREAHEGATHSVRALAGALAEDTAEQPASFRVKAFASVLPRPRHIVVVALSGLDGAGKSTHAKTLRDSLEAIGVRTAVVWSPLGGNFTLDLIAVPGRRVLRAVKRGPFAATTEGTTTGSVMSDPDRTRSDSSATGRAVKIGWATLVLFLNALSQRRAVLGKLGRARVVIFDRYAVDSIVRSRFLYGRFGQTRLQRLIVRRVAPRADVAVLLEIAPETAWARKSDDWTLDQLRRQAELYLEERARFRVQRIDAEAPAEQVAAEIAWAVCRQLGNSRGGET